MPPDVGRELKQAAARPTARPDLQAVRDGAKRLRARRRMAALAMTMVSVGAVTGVAFVASSRGDSVPVPPPIQEPSDGPRLGVIDRRPTKRFGPGPGRRDLSARPPRMNGQTKSLSVTGTGCSDKAPWAIVSLQVYPLQAGGHDPDPLTLETARVASDSQGAWDWTFHLREDTPPGRYSLWSACERVDSYEWPTTLDVGTIRTGSWAGMEDDLEKDARELAARIEIAKIKDRLDDHRRRVAAVEHDRQKRRLLAKIRDLRDEMRKLQRQIGGAQ